MVTPLFVVMTAAAALAVVFFAYSFAAFRRKRPLGGLTRVLLGTTFLLASLLCGAVSLGVHGYQALTRETTAATIDVRSLGERRFEATFTLPDGTERRFVLAGDELYVDAHILKWHPRANLLGLHTAFELDRVAGRYRLLDDEQTQPRTVYSLKSERVIDMFDLARRYEMLRPVLDAEYGSATFVPAQGEARYALQVSTTGLLARRLP